MNITLANQTFDHASYDAEREVLYLRATRGGSTARTDAGPGYALRYDAESNLVGLTIVNARGLLERNGAIVDHLAAALRARSRRARAGTVPGLSPLRLPSRRIRRRSMRS